MNPVELALFPLIEAGWRSNDAEAPTWRQWEGGARKHHQHVPDLSGLVSLNFREELHAIEAAVSGQGIAICSDVLVATELASGALVKLTDMMMPGCSFYIAHRASHPKMSSIKAFVGWAMEANDVAPRQLPIRAPRQRMSGIGGEAEVGRADGDFWF